MTHKTSTYVTNSDGTTYDVKNLGWIMRNCGARIYRRLQYHDARLTPPFNISEVIYRENISQVVAYANGSVRFDLITGKTYRVTFASLDVRAHWLAQRFPETIYTTQYSESVDSNWLDSWNDDSEPTGNQPSTHYIAMAGLRGYMPMLCESCEDRESAIETIMFIHDSAYQDESTESLTNEQYDAMYAEIRRELADNEYVEFDRTIDLPDGSFISIPWQAFGNEYAEVVECDCDDPDCHND